jgi:hypothetical protein
MRRHIIVFLRAINSLSKVIEFPPLSIFFSLWVDLIIPLNSLFKLVVDEGSVLNIIDLFRSMVVSENLRCGCVLNEEENGKGHG